MTTKRSRRREWPFISVVMPVRNEEAFIAGTLKQLLCQDYPRDRFELIVVDGMSSDSTREKVAALAGIHPQVRLAENPKRLSSSGRNIGFKLGQGSIFVVVDGHCFIENDQLFKSIVNCFEKSGAHCLGRPQPLDPPEITRFQQSVALARASVIGHSAESFIYSDQEGYVSPVSVGAVYKREVFEEVGYVDEEFDACEDVEFNYRLERCGMRCYIHPSLRVRYYPRDSLRRLFQQMARYGEGRFRFLRKHPETLDLNLLVPAAFVCAVALFYVFYLFLPRPFALFALAFGLYILLVASEAARLAWKHGWSHLPRIPLILYVIHFGLGFGLLKGFSRHLLALFRHKIAAAFTAKGLKRSR